MIARPLQTTVADEQGHRLLRCVGAAEGGAGRAKLVVADPSGNLVEINSGTRG